RGDLDLSRTSFFGGSVAEEFFSIILRLLCELVFVGPQFIHGSLELFRTGAQWAKMDVEACARVIALLLSRDRRVPLAEISGRLGMLDPMKIVAQLDLLDGVVFLRSPPAGLSLTSDLREELGGTGTRARPAMEQFEAQRIEFDCAGCGRKLRVRITLVGMGIRCPRCRTKYRSVQDGHGRIRLEREVRREQR